MKLADSVVTFIAISVAIYIVTHSDGNGSDLISSLFSGLAKTTTNLQGR